jgi:enoyl-CoA hydratase/carnithine racemase
MGQITLSIENAAATITIDRPNQRNALTLAMYDELLAACRQIAGADQLIALVVFRGAGGAFSAGTDISEFTDFSLGEDGVRYEALIEEVLRTIEDLPMVTCAVVEGVAMGGGCLIAAICDFRIVTPRALFGTPMARTLGNCLSAANVARLVAAVGVHTARRMLLLGQLVDATDAFASRLALTLVESDVVDAEIDRLAETVRTLAPLTVGASKKVINILNRQAPIEDTEIIGRVYGSDDFKAGIKAFLSRTPAEWTGR